MRIIIPSFCLLFALQVQASCFSRILSKLWVAGYADHIGLHKAIDEGKLDIAVDLVKQDKALGEYGVKYMVYKNPAFIANFVNRTNQANASTLDVLCFKSSKETAEKVLGRVNFPQHVLVDSAASYEVASKADKLLVLLNRIVKPEDQERFVAKAIEKLVDKYTETSPLLNTLKGKTFRSKRLEHFAIQKAFMEGVERSIVILLPEGICEHAAITPELYADALIVTAAKGKHSGTQRFLLKNAEQYDLEAVKEKAGYAGLNPAFRGAIEKALGKVAPGGTRTRAYDIQSAEKTKKEFMEIGHAVAILGIADIIGEYLTGKEDEEREVEGVLWKQNDK